MHRHQSPPSAAPSTSSPDPPRDSPSSAPSSSTRVIHLFANFVKAELEIVHMQMHNIGKRHWTRFFLRHRKRKIRRLSAKPNLETVLEVPARDNKGKLVYFKNVKEETRLLPRLGVFEMSCAFFLSLLAIAVDLLLVYLFLLGRNQAVSLYETVCPVSLTLLTLFW